MVLRYCLNVFAGKRIIIFSPSSRGIIFLLFKDYTIIRGETNVKLGKGIILLSKFTFLWKIPEYNIINKRVMERVI